MLRKVLTVLLIGFVLLLALFELTWLGVVVACATLGFIIRLFRARRFRAGALLLTIIALAIVAYSLFQPMYRLLRTTPFDANYEALLRFHRESTEGSQSIIEWQLREYVKAGGDAFSDPSRAADPEASRVERLLAREWNVTRGGNNEYILSRDSTVRCEVSLRRTVTQCHVFNPRLYVPPLGHFVLRPHDGRMVVRAPEHMIARLSPAPSKEAPTTRRETEYTIPLRVYDNGVEMEVLHPALRNVFAVWLRQFTLWQTPKWIIGIFVGVLAAGIGESAKKWWSRQITAPKPQREIGFRREARKPPE